MPPKCFDCGGPHYRGVAECPKYRPSCRPHSQEWKQEQEARASQILQSRGQSPPDQTANPAAAQSAGTKARLAATIAALKAQLAQLEAIHAAL